MPAFPVDVLAPTTQLPCGAAWRTAVLLEWIWEATGADVVGERASYLCRGCHEFHYLELCSSPRPPASARPSWS